MSSWTEIGPILNNIREIINVNVPDLADQLFSFVMPCLLAADEPENPQLRRLILGAKGYEGLQFPQCNIIPVEMAIATAEYNTEEYGLNFRVVTVQEDNGSPWGGSLKTMKLSCDVKDALYKAHAGMKTRTLGGVCNDIFVTGITWETEPLPKASVHWNYIKVLVRKKLSAIQ